MSSVKTIPLAGAPPSTRFTLKIAFSTTPARESIVAVTKSTASRARSKLLTLNSDISQLPSPRNRAMAGWSAGYQDARVRRQLTRGPISSSPGTAGLLPFTFFSPNYPDLDSSVLSTGTTSGLSQNLGRKPPFSRAFEATKLRRLIARLAYSPVSVVQEGRSSTGAELKIMQELLRHSTIRVTLDTYTQAVTTEKRNAQQAVVALLFREKTQET